MEQDPEHTFILRITCSFTKKGKRNIFCEKRDLIKARYALGTKKCFDLTTLQITQVINHAMHIFVKGVCVVYESLKKSIFLQVYRLH